MMKYYKIIRNRTVIDLLSFDEETGPYYVKYQKRNGLLLHCIPSEAQGFFSDNEKVYTTSELNPFPSENMYPTVTLEEISENEYDVLKDRNFKSADQIRDELLLEIIQRGGL